MRLSFCVLDPDEGYRLDAELVVEVPFLFLGCYRTAELATPARKTYLPPLGGNVRARQCRSKVALRVTDGDAGALATQIDGPAQDGA